MEHQGYLSSVINKAKQKERLFQWSEFKFSEEHDINTLNTPNFFINWQINSYFHNVCN